MVLLQDMIKVLTTEDPIAMMELLGAGYSFKQALLFREKLKKYLVTL